MINFCVSPIVGTDQWARTEPEQEHSRVNVSGLTHGRRYELRVVALGHHGDRDDVTSEAQVVRVGYRHGESVTVHSTLSRFRP